ncbi:DEAD/DEAH box helicase family protein [Macrococcus bovicus]|uniref:DUF3427 domain-containing protein n=1 Tax=Macrococcus bovicus TaxID=69968 RepID=A0A4R6C0Q8_9STAP|nr:DUF3427 domain-containing protein [Macrococcus bovicus]TDM14422.1 DUF3427 domain-containing protein [Macrococcus bovicus]
MNNFNHNNKESYVFETYGPYQVHNGEFQLNQKFLDIEKTIKYFINNNEFKIAKELLTKNNYEDILNYINQQQSTHLNEIPFNIKLIGNQDIEVDQDFQLLESKLITNNFNTSENLLDHLISELNTCDSFDIIVSFIKNSGLNILVSTLEQLNRRGIKGRIITTTYMSVTDPAALRNLIKYDNLEVKIYESSNQSDSFHTKGYIFHRHQTNGSSQDDLSSVIIGSSNISAVALKTAEEWNIRTYKRQSDNIFNATCQRFEEVWNNEQTHQVTDSYITQYEKFIKDKNIYRPYFYTFNSQNKTSNQNGELLVPNSMQKEALKNLELLVQAGESKALAIAATGTGKTFLAAWCAKQLRPEKVLFIAHQEELLNGALKTFKKVFNELNENNFGKFVGSIKENKPFTFASIQTLNNHWQQFDKEEYDLVIIDEFHHAASPTYTKIMKYFQPKFLLGLTATPERTDGNNIYDLVDNNVIINIRLREALEHELLVPFQYYGINDDFVELEKKHYSEEEILKALVKHNNERVDFIIANIMKYAVQGKRKCIGFCQSIEHAKLISKEFNQNGFVTTVLTGSNSSAERTAAIKRLQNDEDKLEIIFTVDLFNEGVDIPDINLILFLRPTKSPIIFTQQLGRGLRKHPQKEVLVVLDFVINDTNNYMIPIALIGEKNFKNKNEIKTHIKRNLKDLSKHMHIELDRKSKEKILKSLESFKPFAKKNIIKEILEYYHEIKENDAERKLNILDFENEDAPNLNYISKIKGFSNMSQINRMIKMEREVDRLINSKEYLSDIFTALSYFFPLRRLFDFMVLTNTLIEGVATLENQINFIEKHFDIQLNETAKNKLKFSLLRVGKKYDKFIKTNEDSLVSIYTFEEAVRNELIMYQTFGLNQYQKTMHIEYLKKDIPFELGKEYSTLDLADMMRENSASGPWMKGFESKGNHHFILVTINKDESKKKVNHDYQDYFINNHKFHWESSSSANETNKVKKLLQKGNVNEHFHLLVRKSAKDVFTQPYKYLGEVTAEAVSGDQPINVIWNLEQPVSKFVLEEYLDH